MTAAEAKARGIGHFKKQEWDEAIKEFSTAISLDPTNHIYYSNRSAVYASKGDFESALKDGEKCVELKKEWPKGYNRVGYALFKLSKFEEARKMYEQGLKFDANNKSLKQGLADCEREEQKSGMSSAIWMKIMQDPELSQLAKTDEAFRNKVNMLCQNPQMAMQMGLLQDPQIAKVFQKAFGMNMNMGADPSNTNTNTNTTNANPYDKPQHTEQSEAAAKTMAEEIKKAEAEAEAEAKAEDEPELTEEERKQREEETANKKQALACKQAGNAQYKKQEFELAIAEYQKAQRLDPKNPAYILNESAALFMQQKWEPCLACCERAVQVCREHFCDLSWSFKAYKRMGAVQERRGDWKAAVGMYSKALVEQKDAKLRQHVKKLKKLEAKKAAKALLDPELAQQLKEEGKALFKKSDFRAAIQKFEESSKRNPKDHFVYSNLAIAYCKIMRWDAAIENCDKCLALQPTFVKALIRKGKVLHTLKQYHKALDTFDAAQKLDPQNHDLITAKGQTLMAVQQRNASGEVDEQARARALRDPEVRAAMNDPEVSSVLLQAQSGDPTILMKAMRDRPHIAAKIQKLVAAGILRVG